MISLVLIVLSALGIIGFNWWIPFAEGLILTVAEMANSANSGNSDGFGSDLLANAAMGITAFSCYPLFCGLQVSPWWLLAAPFIFLLAFFFPGGITIVNLVLRHFGIIQLPIWLLVIGVLIDAFSLFAIVWLFLDSRKSSKTNSRR